MHRDEGVLNAILESHNGEVRILVVEGDGKGPQAGGSKANCQ